MKKATLNLFVVIAMTFVAISQARSQDSTAVKPTTDTTKPTATTPPAAEPAKSDDESSFRFGIVTGINFSYIGNTPVVPTSQSEIGYMIGLTGSTSGNFFLQPGIQFASYVNTLSYGDSTSTEGQTDHFSRCNYIRIPLQAGFRLFGRSEKGVAPPFNVELRLGVSESFLVGATDHINKGAGQAFVKDDFESMRTGLIAGLGVQVLFLSVNFEYEWGVSNHFSSDASGDAKLDALYIVFGGSF